MRAISITAPRRVEVLIQKARAPGNNEATVRFLQGGICGSDVAAYQGTSPMVIYPRVIGHELVGRVIAAGEGASDWLDAIFAAELHHRGHIIKQKIDARP